MVNQIKIRYCIEYNMLDFIITTILYYIYRSSAEITNELATNKAEKKITTFNTEDLIKNDIVSIYLEMWKSFLYINF